MRRLVFSFFFKGMFEPRQLSWCSAVPSQRFDVRDALGDVSVSLPCHVRITIRS